MQNAGMLLWAEAGTLASSREELATVTNVCSVGQQHLVLIAGRQVLGHSRNTSPHRHCTSHLTGINPM